MPFLDEKDNRLTLLSLPIRDRGMPDPKNTLRPDLEQQQHRLLDKLEETWVVVLKMLVEAE
jgi:hypothetical protein